MLNFSKLCVLIVAIVTGSSMTAGCGQRGGHLTAADVREIASPAPKESGQANLTVGPAGDAYLSWMEINDAGSPVLKFAAKTGESWSEPHVIVQNDDLLMNYADFPSLLALDNGVLAAHWLSLVPDEEGYNVNVAISRDHGQTWGKPVVPHRDGTPTEHGFVSMVPDPTGGITALWLDSRKLHGNGGHSDEVAMMASHINLDGTAGAESVLDGRVCECCQPSAAVVPGGLLAVYRSRSEAEIRDISIVRFDGHQWSSPKTIFEDDWEIYACPINGPAIAADGQNVAVAWLTGAHDKVQVKVVFSSDGGSTFGPAIPIDDGNPLGRVDIVKLKPQGALVSWMEKAAKGAEVRVREVQPDQTRQPSITIGTTGAGTSSSFPRMERTADTVLFEWTDTNEDRVRTAAATLK